MYIYFFSGGCLCRVCVSVATSSFSHDVLLKRDLWLSEKCLNPCSDFMAVDIQHTGCADEKIRYREIQ